MYKPVAYTAHKFKIHSGKGEKEPLTWVRKSSPNVRTTGAWTWVVSSLKSNGFVDFTELGKAGVVCNKKFIFTD